MTSLRPIKQVFLSLLLITVLTACDDDDATQPEGPATPSTNTTIHSQQDFLQKYMPKSEFHTINSDTSIVMAKGATFNFI